MSKNRHGTIEPVYLIAWQFTIVTRLHTSHDPDHLGNVDPICQKFPHRGPVPIDPLAIDGVIERWDCGR